jgi:hypothetical protein
VSLEKKEFFSKTQRNFFKDKDKMNSTDPSGCFSTKPAFIKPQPQKKYEMG